MAVKTITITENAYETLKKLKNLEESFSEVILRVSGERKGNIINFYGALKDSKGNLGIIRRRIKDRRKEIDNEVNIKRNKLGGRFK